MFGEIDIRFYEKLRNLHGALAVTQVNRQLIKLRFADNFYENTFE
jgi:hypothetical protein